MAKISQVKINREKNDSPNGSSILFTSKIDLSEKVRRKVIEMLNTQLASATDLYLQAKQAHWNVKGPDFISLHELFDKVYNDVGEYVDLLAERITQLGGVAMGTVRAAAKNSTLEEYPHHISRGSDHVEALSTALAAFGKQIRKGIEEFEDAGDQDAADICTQISRGIDKYLWFVEAHLQADFS